MVSIYKTEKVREGNYITTELRGLSTEDKPTAINGNIIDNGSTFIEIDTGDEYMYDLVNTTWYKTSGNGGGSMSKFDYIIPSGLYEDVSGEITDEDIISVLEEIDDNFLDEEGNVKPLNIGVYVGNNDQGLEGYFTNIFQIGKTGTHANLFFISNIDYTPIMCSIYYQSNSWNISVTSI